VSCVHRITISSEGGCKVAPGKTSQN
jgi:hypothetical protein